VKKSLINWQCEIVSCFLPRFFVWMATTVVLWCVWKVRYGWPDTYLQHSSKVVGVFWSFRFRHYIFYFLSKLFRSSILDNATPTFTAPNVWRLFSIFYGVPDPNSFCTSKIHKLITKLSKFYGIILIQNAIICFYFNKL